MENLFWKDKRILVTGGHGFLGSYVVDILKRKNPRELSVPSGKEYDLRKLETCKELVKDKDIIIHLAARCGGIGLNRAKPADLFYDNLIMGIQLMEQARLVAVNKFVTLGTVCAYPKFTAVPFREENLWAGYPEETNAPYGLAKKMLLVQGQAYRQQHGFNAIFLLPANLYGPGDHFDERVSHVIPAIIRKVVDAKRQRKPSITLWGDGSPTREFFYVEDAAWAILLATEKYDKPEPVNLGTGQEISIAELAKLIMRLCDYPGKIRWDRSKPNGQPRRSLDTSRAKAEFGFEARIGLEEGLRKTIEWYYEKSHAH